MKNIRMKVARVEKDISQEDLANMVGVTRQTIGMINQPSHQCISGKCW